MNNTNVPSTNIISNSTNLEIYNPTANAAAQGAFLEAERKSEGAEKQALLSLAAILNSVAQTLSEGSSGSESTNPNSASTPKIVKSAAPSNQKSGGLSLEQMAVSAAVMNNLNQLQKTLSQNSQTSPTTNNQSQNTEESIINALSAMTNALGQLEGHIAQSASKKASYDVEVSQSFTQAAQDALTKAQQQMAQIAKEQEHQHKMHILGDILSVIVTAVVDTVACAFGQVQIAAIATTMCVLQVSGAMSDVTKAISGAIATDLENHGMSKAQAEKDANAIADAIVLIMVVVCTAGAGAATGVGSAAPAAAVTAAGEGAEAATEVTEEALEVAAEAATNIASDAATEISSTATSVAKQTTKAAAKNVAEQGIEMAEVTGESTAEDASTNITESITESAENNEKSISSKIFEAIQNAYKNTIGKVYENNPLRKMNALANLTLTTGLQATMSTGLAGNITAAAMSAEGKSEEEIARATAIVNIVTGVICMVGMSFSADGLASGMQNSTKSIPAMKDLFNKFPMLFQTLTNMKFTAESAQVVTGLLMGASKTEQAKHTEEQAIAEGTLQEMTEFESASSNAMVNSQKAFTGLLKGHEEIDQTTMQQMLSYEATYTQLLSQTA